ncbi:MAG: GIY-YIG nuclease family protein [Gammaproteobacteria bacterium]|nr:GIY-YIG nuclease family protein [Gammaproteobacteria bacterium]MDP2141943.1 GIY-YIG nuclease family protein [Gammaproteobacteria bacterium]MDP2347175.1 GIY-YIG nuclease family protein [Gammaproteobacteria bacterium]
MADSLESTEQAINGGWFLYLVRCRNGTFYTGITTDVERRFAEHQKGGVRAARYLRGKGPLELVYTIPAGDRALASTLENRVKSLTRADKQNLIAGCLDILSTDVNKNIKKDNNEQD